MPQLKWGCFEFPNRSIVSYQEYLTDRPEELYFAMLEYFEPEEDDFDEEYEEESPLE